MGRMMNYDFSLNEEKTGEGWSQRIFRRKLSTKEKQIFFFSLSRLLKGGIPVLKAVANLSAGAVSSVRMRQVLLDLETSLSGGQSFAEAIADHGGDFMNHEIALIHAGENSGNLERAFSQLAQGIKAQREAAAKIKEAVSYPVLILVLGIATVWILSAVVIPKLAAVYDDFGAELPFLTCLVIDGSTFFRTAFLPTLAILMLLAVFFRKKMSAAILLFLPVPIAGELLRHFILQRFCSLLALMLNSGIPMLKALDYTAACLPGRKIRDALNIAREAVEKGNTVSGALAEQAWMNSMSLALIMAGEESGALPESLEETAHFSLCEMEAFARILLKLLEPGLILFVGICAGIVVIALVLPILQISSLV